MFYYSGADVTVSPTLVESSGDWVTVQWSNVESPSTNDVVAVFPSASGILDYKKNAPIKFQVNVHPCTSCGSEIQCTLTLDYVNVV